MQFLFQLQFSILVFWYSRQEMFIRWGNSCSTKFRVTNGVKQGGILSPALFNVYMCRDATKGTLGRKNQN